MIPGPDQVIACPHCEGPASYMTLLSGNTFGARVWTDGKQVAPMLPQPPAVAKCRHCGECYWLAEAKEVGTVDRWGEQSERVNPAWAAAPGVEEPTEEEYYQALEGGLAKGPQQERNLRVLAWWRRNDAFRDLEGGEPASIATLSEACRKNLEALATLLDEGETNERIMKGEVLRELGEFRAAKEVLGRAIWGKYASAIRKLRSLCDSGDTTVREL